MTSYKQGMLRTYNIFHQIRCMNTLQPQITALCYAVVVGKCIRQTYFLENLSLEALIYNWLQETFDLLCILPEWKVAITLTVD